MYQSYGATNSLLWSCYKAGRLHAISLSWKFDVVSSRVDDISPFCWDSQTVFADSLVYPADQPFSS